MNEFLFWSDNKQFYFLATYGSLAVLILLSAQPLIFGTKKVGFLNSNFLFLFVSLMFLIIARWPSLFWYRGYSIDEDQFLSAAWVLLQDPLFFRSVETASSGPMNIYPILLPNLWGASIDFMSMRLVSLVLWSVAVGFAFFAVLSFVNVEFARVGMLLPIAFYGLTAFWDFTGYPSEIPSLTFIFAGLFCASKIWALDPGRKKTIVFLSILGALSLSLVPFAKLQSIYLGFAVGGLLILSVAAKRCIIQRVRLSALVAVFIGVLAFPLGFSLVLIYNDCFNYFINAYLLNAISYVDAGLQGFNPFLFFGEWSPKPQTLKLFSLVLRP